MSVNMIAASRRFSDCTALLGSSFIDRIILLALYYCQLSGVCRLTPKRTASGPTESFQLEQCPSVTAMRWHAGLARDLYVLNLA